MLQRTRDVISEPVTLDYFERRQRDGWKLAAVEWVKHTDLEEVVAEAGGQSTAALSPEEEIPYGYRIGDDCVHLAEHPLEIEAMTVMLEKVVEGWRPGQIADELNLRGYRTRKFGRWTAGAVFELLPRLIELSPRLLKRPDWPARRAKLEVIG